MFPFAGHKEYGYTLEYADKELKEAGDTAKRLGVRLTTHPGQFNQLGSYVTLFRISLRQN